MKQNNIEKILNQLRREIRDHKEKLSKLVNRKDGERYYYSFSENRQNYEGLFLALLDELER